MRATPWAEESCAVGAEEGHDDEMQHEFRRRDRQGQEKTGGAVEMRWKTAKVSSLCDLRNGKAYNADEWATEGLPIIRIKIGRAVPKRPIVEACI
jgi:hypothetical protein